jgi:hypothetical protein
MTSMNFEKVAGQNGERLNWIGSCRVRAFAAGRNAGRDFARSGFSIQRRSALVLVGVEVTLHGCRDLEIDFLGSLPQQE